MILCIVCLRLCLHMKQSWHIYLRRAHESEDFMLSCQTLTATTTLQAFTEQSMEFQRKMVANGGLGQETYLPEGAMQMFHLWLRLSGKRLYRVEVDWSKRLVPNDAPLLQLERSAVSE